MYSTVWEIKDNTECPCKITIERSTGDPILFNFIVESDRLGTNYRIDNILYSEAFSRAERIIGHWILYGGTVKRTQNPSD